MTILFYVSGQLRFLVWSKNLLIRMKRLTSRTTRYLTTTSILPRCVRSRDNCGRALSNESVAKTAVAERCPDESVANATVLDRMAKYAAWHERSTSSLNAARCRNARLQSHTIRLQNYFKHRIRTSNLSLRKQTPCQVDVCQHTY